MIFDLEVSNNLTRKIFLRFKTKTNLMWEKGYFKTQLHRCE